MVTSGVPQGSVLGPLLFIILMLGIGRELQHSKSNSFADDTKLLSFVQGVNDTISFQDDIDSIYNWAKIESNMVFNSEKFQLVRYGLNEQLKQSTKYLDSAGSEIVAVDTAKDLGVLMSSSGTFDIHTRKTIQTCNFVISQILRTFTNRSTTTMLTPYTNP